MFLWPRHFETISPMESLPCLRVVASEVQYSSEYYFAGKDRHREKHCLFKYTLAGEGAFCDAGGRHRLLPGKGFLTRINDPATSYFFPPEAREEWTFLWLAFSGPAADSIVRDFTRRWGHLYDLAGNSQVISQLMAFSSAGSERKTLGALEGSVIVMNLFAELARCRESGGQQDPANLLVGRAQRAVTDNLAGDLNASGLADILDVSREHLSRVFQQHLKMGPYQYITRQRALRACRMLSETQFSAKEIAAQLGYPNPAQFSRSFKKIVGVTPGQFRSSGMLLPVL